MTHSKLLLGLLILACSIGCQYDKDYHKNMKDGVFIHISHGPEDAHRVLMGLKMADLMADTQDVLVYFDIKGIEAVLKDFGDMEHKGFPSFQEQIKGLKAKGVTLLACPGCLNSWDKGPEDLMEGIQVASKDPFFNFTNGRILTLDY